MKNTLWTFGCSFTAEYHPLNNTPPNNYDLYREFRGGTLPDVWPTLLSNKLNFNLKNLGKGASSNDTIFKTFCDNVSYIQENDIVIIGWTQVLRAIMANTTCEENHLQDVLISNDYPEWDREWLDLYFINRSSPAWNEQLMSYTRIINELSKLKKFKILYWTSDETIFEYFNEKFEDFNEINFLFKNHSFSLIDILLTYVTEGFPIQIINETNGVVEDAHMGEVGHEKQSEIVFKHLKSNGYL